MDPATAPPVEDDDARAWAASGAMALSGPEDGEPCGPPGDLVGVVGRWQARLAAASAAVGQRVEVDGLALLGERAALDGLGRRGRTSCGGATRLLRAADGWVAASLARPDDVASLAAWLGPEAVGSVRPETGSGPAGDGVWALVGEAVGGRRCDDLVEGAALLGLPVAALGERPDDGSGGVTLVEHGPAPPAPVDRLRVVDLSSLWAGPLCASLLAAAGAEVVKVESTARPDAARAGSPALFDLLNAGKRSVALDLASPEGRRALAHLVGGADVVVEASRPRALAQLGLRAQDLLARPDGPRLWVSLTGHGRGSPRVAFGDDAAVAGGLVVDRPAVTHRSRGSIEEGTVAGPWFCSDAVADPLAGLAAAASALEVLRDGGRPLLDVALAGVAASAAGPTAAVPSLPVAPPRARPRSGEAPSLGADTEAVLARW